MNINILLQIGVMEMLKSIKNGFLKIIVHKYDKVLIFDGHSKRVKENF